MTQHALNTIGSYENRFGFEHTEALIAPNYLGDPAFIAALEEAVTIGHPLTLEAAAARFGPAFRDAVDALK